MTVPTLVVGSNTYVTRSEATDLLDSRVFGDNWSGATTANQDKALLQARTILDTFFDWKGSPVSLDLSIQPLDWPRYGVYDRDGRYLSHTTVPALLKKAQAEFANYLLGEDVSEKSAGSGEITELAAGPLKVKFNNSGASSATGLVPDYFVALLADLGVPSSATGGSSGGMVTLLRG